MNEFEYTFGHTDVTNTLNKCRINDNGIHFDPRYKDALALLPEDHVFSITL
jgi:hypothetical protein